MPPSAGTRQCHHPREWLGLQSGFLRDGDRCVRVTRLSVGCCRGKVVCRPGFAADSRGGCQQIVAPANAIMNNGWVCNPGYVRDGDGCRPSDRLYKSLINSCLTVNIVTSVANCVWLVRCPDLLITVSSVPVSVSFLRLLAVPVVHLAGVWRGFGQTHGKWRSKWGFSRNVPLWRLSP